MKFRDPSVPAVAVPVKFGDVTRSVEGGFEICSTTLMVTAPSPDEGTVSITNDPLKFPGVNPVGFTDTESVNEAFPESSVTCSHPQDEVFPLQTLPEAKALLTWTGSVERPAGSVTFNVWDPGKPRCSSCK